MIERYTRPAMAAIWSEEKKLSTWLEVETIVCEELEALGLCPSGTGAKIRQKARFDASRIKGIEERVKHDVIAFVSNVGESLGDESRFFHFGLTSSDLLDTSQAILCRDACSLIEGDLKELRETLKSSALAQRRTIMAGRTHGVHAEPITFGLKLLVWYEEAGRNLARIAAAREDVAVGKISGAVGTFSHQPIELEERVCGRLGLKPERVSTQIVQRDRYAALLSSLALTASSLEKFATEIRHLQRTEVREVEESFVEGQKGSSAMPHKRNPILSERICGLARVVRNNSIAGMENVILWHERDISHSSAERIIIPDSFILVDYMLGTFNEIMRTLRVFPERMLENLKQSGDTIFSQRIMLELVKSGMRRDEAYELVQASANLSIEGKKSFKDVAATDKRLLSSLGQDLLESCFDLSYYLRNVDGIYKRVLGE